jgi:macrodomain Ter protein organizer (MatP/YcbG family)
MSMMCHIARIMHQGDTFRMNVGDTKPYNADFDGDEMNMHMPQDEEAEAELKNLAAVPYQIISPAKNQSIIGIFQDSLLGSYRFTRPGVSFTPRDAMNLLMAYNGVNEGLFAGHAERITSFQILSQIMPAFTMKYKTKGFGENDDFATSPGVLEIVDGKYLRGQLDKDVLGGGSNGLITRTCNDFGNMAASDFIDNLQNIVTEYMKGSAYSVGISDLIANRSTNEQIAQSITSKKKEVKNLIDQTYLGIFENATGNTNEDEFEFQVTNILNKATNDSGKIGLKSLDKDNRFVTMVKAGSKGSDLNISQMIACLGQQLIDGKRIPYGFENRTLPHFTKYDDSPGARGFVENSFISGLTPEELFFHAMGGRVGLIDTAVKSVTWETPVIVVENDEPKYVKIGEWIDSHISSSHDGRVQRMTEQNMEYLELDHPVKIVTMDYDGHVSWETVSAVTRHDPGEKLYKITTHAGRYVTVTANKSLLVWNAELGQFREKYTDEIKVGDFVPVAKHVCNYREEKGDSDAEFERGRSAGNSIENRIPVESYIAGKEYIKGLITCYFSKHAVVSHESSTIEFTSGENRLVEDLAFICSRLGIHAEVSIACRHSMLTIRGSNVQQFAHQITLDDEEKDQILKSILPCSDSQSVINDVVLDAIVSIEPEPLIVILPNP